MLNRKILEEFPAKRIAAMDGMAVTAQVWEEAHAYHRDRQRVHDLLSHGMGIVTGLEVIASDPPDSSLYVLPGIAVDSNGESIILTDPLAYDVGTARGRLSLLLTYEESRPSIEQEDGPFYIRAQFGIAAEPSLARATGVELARIHRPDGDAPIRNARDAEYPGANELDLRFRQDVGWQRPVAREAATVAVCYTSALEDTGRGHGAGRLARALRHAGRPIWVDDRVPLASDLKSYTMVYLVGQDDFQLSRDEMNALYAYLQAGGGVLFESCRRGELEGAPPADAAFFELMASMGIELAEIRPGHLLLVEPNLFAEVPPGFESDGPPRVWAGGGVIFSACDYGCLWRGARRRGTPSREEIRTAIEWGENLVTYVQARQQRAGSA
jgi:hypothetical protein